jgi:hypothetical protein
MTPDPLIDEIRAVRRQISERFGGDTQALIDHYRDLEKAHAERMLRDDSHAPAVAKAERPKKP